jgi:hypothetical protein
MSRVVEYAIYGILDGPVSVGALVILDILFALHNNNE